jgi:hypothetical protein
MPSKVKPWYDYARNAVNVIRSNTPLAILKCKPMVAVKMLDNRYEISVEG